MNHFRFILSNSAEILHKKASPSSGEVSERKNTFKALISVFDTSPSPLTFNT